MSEEKEVQESVQKSRSPRYYDFACELYPDRLEHMDMLKYLKDHSYLFKIVYILHDRDTYDQDDVNKIMEKKAAGKYEKEVPNVGDPKQPHYHVAIHSSERMTLRSFLKFFHIWIDYAETLSNFSHYIVYMLHDTPSSMHKVHYSPDELNGDEKLISKAVGQNSNFVQLAEITTMVQQSETGSLVELIDNISGQDVEEIDKKFKTISSYQSLICNISNQVMRMKSNLNVQERLFAQDRQIKDLALRLAHYQYTDNLEARKKVCNDRS